MSKSENFLDFVPLSNGLRLHNPTVEDMLSPTKQGYLSVLTYQSDIETKTTTQVLFELSLIEETCTTVEQAFLFFFPDWEQVLFDTTQVCLGNARSGDIVRLDETALTEIREKLEELFSNNDELPKNKVKFKNERQKKLWERREETRRQLAEAKKRSGSEDFTIGDLVIALCVLGHYTRDQVFGFPFAFAQELLKRFQKAESFHIEVQTAMFAKKAELTYWLG